jgi:hypothetical protein
MKQGQQTRNEMSKSIHPIEQEELMAYLDGELEADRATVAASHLERCKDCQKLAADLRDVSQKLMVWQVPPSDSQITPEISAALEENAPEEDATKRKNVNRRRKTWREILSTRRLLFASSFAAVCAVVIGLGLSTMRVAPAFLSQSVANKEIPQRQKIESGAPLPTLSRESQGGPADSNGNYEGRTNFAYDSLNNLTSAVPQSASGLVTPNPPRLQQARKEQKHDSAIPAGPMVVRTVELALITTEFDQARKNLEDTVKRHHGYFGNLTTGGAADAGRTLDAILRVPADQLDAALAELKNLGRVESESQKGDEVSQQYVDLQARLTNARNTEQRLTDLLRQRTGRLSDVLEVEQQIDSVRERIEQMDAEKKNLANQVAFATLTMKMREDYKAHVQMVPPSTSSRIRNAAVDGYETMVAGLIGIALLLASWGPSLLLWSLILFFPVRSVWRKVRRIRAAN